MTEFLLDKIGGEPALEATVDELYSRIMADDGLSPFFEGVDMDKLREHMRKFLRVALTKIPTSLDVEGFLYEKHKRLFLDGLNGGHFDAVAGHLIGTLESLKVPKTLIDETVGIVAPLRGIFEQGEAKAKNEVEKEGEAEKVSLFERLGGEAAIEAAVEGFYTRLVADDELSQFFEGIDIDKLKGHQRNFLKVAFTEIPKDLDVEVLMYKKHYKLFQKGLNGTHFDLVAGHLVGTLQSLEVTSDLIDEVVAVVAPLRPVFEKGIKK